ncbi:MAG: hypothetical protein M1831_001358 [Alyxoria varia]|nr:MAG: hypothetical protein M1831_001358 [Alyxoria varia]
MTEMRPRDTNLNTTPRSSRHYHDSSTSSSGSVTPQSPRHPAEERYGDGAASAAMMPLWLQKTARVVPGPLKRVFHAVIKWVRGPDPPRIWKITPFLPKLQALPIRLLDRYVKTRMQRVWLLLALYFCFLLCFVTILHESAFTSEIPGYGSPSVIGCTDSFWTKNNGCGLDGDQCRPFQNSTIPFRCPADCLRTQVLNPYGVGDQRIVYQPLVIGGPRDSARSVETAAYRGDSFICSAAIHSGFVTNSEGGCGVVELVGQDSNYPSVNQHAIQSIGFDTNFPLTMKFVPGSRAECKDLRWPLLAVTVIFTCLLAIFTVSPSIYFGSIFCMLFFHVALVSDPPSLSTYYSLVSQALGSFLPAAFVAVVVYWYCIKRQLDGLEAQVEKTILWLGPCLVGCLNNYTFDKIPIQRLTPHDIQQQPGAVPALVIIVLVLVCIALGQAWAIRVEGRMPRYLALYALIGFCLLMFVAIPNMSLRIHHYILALLLLPGTAMQNRPSLVYQGLLIGLFINGIARWGFDSVLQTPGDLQGDALLGSELPNIMPPNIASNNITFNWQPPPEGHDGISVMVNDVERFRGFLDDGVANFTWSRKAPHGNPEYFRFALMSGSETGDYTKAGIWASNGSWQKMPPGPT